MKNPSLDTQQLLALAKTDPLIFGISFIDLLEGRKWEIEKRRWVIDLYKTVNPFDIALDPQKPRRMVVTKCTQAGISTMSIVKALHFMTFWDVRVGYMLPRQKDISDFSATRLDPIIRSSPFLSSRLRHPDSVFTKRLGNSYLFFLEGSVEPRAMPLDALFLDEVDLCDPEHVGTAINRLDASPWKLVTYLSTPTLPMAGIDGLYEASDQRRWFIKCPHCGHRQVMDWEKHVRIKGSPSDPERVWYICEHCEKEITNQDMQNGEWVAAYPNRSDYLVGYHISQMLIMPAHELYRHFIDPSQNIAEFYRKRLGRPYSSSGGSLTRDDLLVACFNEPFQEETFPDGRSAYYIGVDQGNQLQVAVGKLEPNKRSIKIVHLEIVPFEIGFNRIGQLIRLFNPRRVVIDGNPNRHAAAEIQRDFPGRVLLADYIEHQPERFKVRRDPKTKMSIGVAINRTQAFDQLMRNLQNGMVQVYGEPPNLPPEVETWIDQITSLKRDVEKRKTPNGEVEVAVWRKLRADHYAHATLYLTIGAEIDRGSGFRVAVIGETTHEEDVATLATNTDESLIKDIIWQLSEVPTDQLREYLALHDDQNYTPEFPLSFKLTLLNTDDKAIICEAIQRILKLRGVV